MAALCAVVAVMVAADQLASAGEIRRGVEVGGVSLGGKTPAEARSMLQERVRAVDEIRLDGLAGATVEADLLSLDYDVAATVEEAYAVGRRGDVARRFADRARTVVSTVRVEPVAEYRPEVARAEVRTLARRVDAGPRAASVEIDGSQVRVVEARPGYALDVDATVEGVDEAVRDMRGEAAVVGETLDPEVSTRAAEHAAEETRRALSGPVTLTAGDERWTLSPARLGRIVEFTPESGGLRVGIDRNSLDRVLSGVRSEIEEEPVEAAFEVEEGEVSVTPGRAGRGVAAERLAGEIEASIFEGRREFRVPTVAVEPELTTAEAEELKPTGLLGRYRTNYTISGDSSAERVENLEIASGAIDGTALAPGEVFSFNELAAPLEYNEAKVIVDGQVAYEDGGGLCQVSSTLYMAANYAGLDVVERHPHYAELPYIRPGFDATVWFGSLDMKFRNTTDGYVLIRETVAEDGHVYAEIWGQPTGAEVSMTSKRVSSGPNSTSWVTYQEVTEGEDVLFDGVLHRDTYEPLTSESGEPIPNAEPAPVNP